MTQNRASEAQGGPSPRGIDFDYRPGDRLMRQDTDHVTFAFTVVDADMGAVVILPPRWASDDLIDVLSWYAEAVIGGTCPRCRATSFALDERRQIIDLEVNGQGVIPIAMTHEPGCRADEQNVKAMLGSEMPPS
jgi:hypothetical protein